MGAGCHNNNDDDDDDVRSAKTYNNILFYASPIIRFNHNNDTQDRGCTRMIISRKQSARDRQGKRVSSDGWDYGRGVVEGGWTLDNPLDTRDRFSDKRDKQNVGLVIVP